MRAFYWNRRETQHARFYLFIIIQWISRINSFNWAVTAIPSIVNWIGEGMMLAKHVLINNCYSWQRHQVVMHYQKTGAHDKMACMVTRKLELYQRKKKSETSERTRPKIKEEADNTKQMKQLSLKFGKREVIGPGPMQWERFAKDGITKYHFLGTRLPPDAMKSKPVRYASHPFLD